MNKQEILKEYKNEEEKLLVAKALDKIDFATFKNKITNTDFLDLSQKSKLQRLFNQIKFKNYHFFGGFEQAERTVAIFYPDKFDISIVQKNYNNIMQILEIILPNDLNGKYTHRDYLGGLMKLGIKREKIGDIVVFNEGAHIIVQNEVIEYIKNNITELTRFSKSKITQKSIEEIHKLEIKKEEIKTSRTKAEEIIKQERVLVNFEVSIKDSKVLKEQDIITIRGKGRFKLLEIIGNTKKGKFIINIEKYI